jgi:putative GTP pyrophosphokinase
VVKQSKRKRPATAAQPKLEAAVNAFRAKRPLHEELARQVATILEGVLKERGVEYHSVPYRAKSIDSYAAKAERYDDPSKQIHDMAGVRVILYVESEARKAAELVRELFEIDDSNTVDKTVELGVDQMGYRAVHYVATLTSKRCALPDFAKYSGMVFEVQVLTILQHTWAEIEHDRNYKFGGVLPNEIQRRFALLAGSVELLNREFDRLADDIDKYARAVATKATRGDLDIQIDNISLRGFAIDRFRDAVASHLVTPEFGEDDEHLTMMVHRMHEVGLNTLDELSKIIPADLQDRLINAPQRSSPPDFQALFVTLLLAGVYERYMVRLQGKFRTKIREWWRALGVDVDRMQREGHMLDS